MKILYKKIVEKNSIKFFIANQTQIKTNIFTHKFTPVKVKKIFIKQFFKFLLHFTLILKKKF